MSHYGSGLLLAGPPEVSVPPHPCAGKHPCRGTHTHSSGPQAINADLEEAPRNLPQVLRCLGGPAAHVLKGAITSVSNVPFPNALTEQRAWEGRGETLGLTWWPVLPTFSPLTLPPP